MAGPEILHTQNYQNYEINQDMEGNKRALLEHCIKNPVCNIHKL